MGSHCASSHEDNRLAKDKFGEVANEFMTYVQQQMGVKVFMLVAFQDENGQDIVSKWASPQLCPVQLLIMFAELRLMVQQEDSPPFSTSMVVRPGSIGEHLRLKVIALCH
jgi:hypothetical protein